MLTTLRNVCPTLSNLVRRTSSRNSSQQTLHLETLEDRVLLATYLWSAHIFDMPTNSYLMSNPQNWTVNGIRLKAGDAAPTNNDTLWFTSNSVEKAVNDIPTLNAISRIQVDKTYNSGVAGKAIIDFGAAPVTLKDGYMAGGTVKGDIVIDTTVANTDFVWKGGTFEGDVVNVDDMDIEFDAAANIKLVHKDGEFENGTEGKIEFKNGTLYQDSSTILNLGTFDVTGTAAGIVPTELSWQAQQASTFDNCLASQLTIDVPVFDIWTTFENSGTTSLAVSRELLLAGGGTLDGTIDLDNGGRLDLAALLTLTDHASPLRIPYTVELNFQLTGTGTLGLVGGKNGTHYIDADLTLNPGTTLALPNTIAITTQRGIISGGGELSLLATNNVIRNTWVVSGTTVRVKSDAKLTFEQGQNIPRNEVDSARFQSGAKIIAEDAEIIVDGADLYLGTNGLIQLDAGQPVGQVEQPSKLLFKGDANLKVVAGKTGMKVVATKSDVENLNANHTVIIQSPLEFKGSNQPRLKGKIKATGSVLNDPQQVGWAEFGPDLHTDPTGHFTATGYITSSGDVDLEMDLVNSGYLTPGGVGDFATLSFDGDYTQSDTGSLVIDLADNDNDVLEVTGDVSLDGFLELDALFTSAPASPIVLLDKAGSTTISGNFIGMTEGTVLNLGGFYFQLTYAGGDGNDVALVPTTPTGNLPPEASNDSFFTVHDQTLTMSAAQGLLANDYDPEFQPLTITAINGQAANVGQAITISGATLTVNADGSFTFVPPAAITGRYVINYTVSDGVHTDIATVVLEVTNQAPIAFNDMYSAIQDTTLTVNAAQGLLANDTDPDGDTLTLTAVNGDTAAVGSAITLSSGATLTVAADGSFVYTPATGFVGQDVFSYTIFDGLEYVTATVVIDVF